MMGRELGEPEGARVLVADPDLGLGDRLGELMGREEGRIEVAVSGEEALRRLRSASFDAVVLDLDLSEGDAPDLLARTLTAAPDARILAATGRDGAEARLDAMRRGAFDCLPKPVEPEELLLALQRAIRARKLHREVARLRSRCPGVAGGRLVGRSSALQRTLDLVERAAPTRSTVLVRGEEGVGKEAVARMLHALSPRARGPFVPVRCSALLGAEADAELFGHVGGRVPGAPSGRRGLVEEAHGGTLFLDEVGATPTSAQARLLQLLEERRARRVGGEDWAHLDVRVVAAVSDAGAGLAEAVEGGRFREDFYHHLTVFPVEVPPLRERREDVPLLAHHFRSRFAAENDVSVPGIPAETMDRMMAYDWPGNVRELEKFVERAMIVHAGEASIAFEPPAIPEPTVERELLRQAERSGWDLARLEKAYILRVLERTDGNQTRAAEILGIDRRTVYRKLKRYRESGDGG